MNQIMAMRVFLAVADTQGFAPAARRLGLSTSAVSRHVADLEAHLSTSLLRRTTRRLSLTEAGEQYLPRAASIIDEIDALDHELNDYSQTPKGRLRLTSSPSFGDYFLAPIAAQFAKAHPTLRVEMDFTERLVDLVSEGYDAAVRAGVLADSSLRARKVAELSFVAVASPEYLATAGPLRTPSDLAHHDCIHWRWRAPKLSWRFRRGDEVIESPPVTGRFLATSTIAERAGALTGLGVALLAPHVVSKDIAAGKLAPVLEDYTPEPMPVNIVWPAMTAQPPKLRVFIDFLVDAMQLACVDCPDDTFDEIFPPKVIA